MHGPGYYRRQAQKARYFAQTAIQDDLSSEFAEMARDFDEIAIDLESGAVEIRHPELMPQNAS